jgi:hypothetical protein
MQKNELFLFPKKADVYFSKDRIKDKGSTKGAGKKEIRGWDKEISG